MTRFPCNPSVPALFLAGLALLGAPRCAAAVGDGLGPSAHILLDQGWHFAFGHPFGPAKDFGHATGYFSYFAKAGYGDGPAAEKFDDRAWRVLSLPHDWADEMPFDPRAGYSHGYRAVGRLFPDTSVGWYRRKFPVPQSDLGRRISVHFEGVFRDSEVWINGYYLGREPSGYSGFRYDLTDYLHYGGDNVISVRVDATMEEGWFYEGAGIYRHVWLDKTAPIHIAPDGVFVTSDLGAGSAAVTARATIANDGTATGSFELEQEILSGDGRQLAYGIARNLSVDPGASGDFSAVLTVANPRLWSLDDPYMHTLVTRVLRNGSVVDSCRTEFGIRTVRFDPDRGFFLNGVRVEIKGTNEHQDFGGVGVAVPDSIQEYRVERLKSMGSNAVRCAHNIPSPAFLDACDRLGMLVLDENRRMGTTQEILGEFKRMILRDRNHPSVILWSMGNEEWSMEGNITGARVASTMQAFGHRLDPSRSFTAAVSGGWDNGIGMVTDVMGYNYIPQGNIDGHHALFPIQSGVGTEETTTRQTRGVYFDDRAAGHIGQTYSHGIWGCEAGWQFYSARPFLSGLFFWTGFDYGGEPEPCGWPQVSSHSGILDLCGFPKDSYYYLKAWWTDEPVLHVLPHWNWPGREGAVIPVKVYGNCDEVELFLNGASLGRKPMPRNGSISWSVVYQPGTLLARGYVGGHEIAVDKVETTGQPAAIELVPDRVPDLAVSDLPTLTSLNCDAMVVVVKVDDDHGRNVPTAQTPLAFSIEGPGSIIGVANGDPACHEPDQFLPATRNFQVRGWRVLEIGAAPVDPSQLSAELDDSGWRSVFSGLDQKYPAAPAIFRGNLNVETAPPGAKIVLFLPPLGESEDVYLNGLLLARGISRADAYSGIPLDAARLSAGGNTIAFVALPLDHPPRSFDYTSPGEVQDVTPAGTWRRSAFNGLAAVIVQATGGTGEITLTASAPGLAGAKVTLLAR
jgi:beta-galactosidase